MRKRETKRSCRCSYLVNISMAYGKVLCLSLKPLPPPEPPPQPGWHSYYNCKYELYLAAATATRISRVAATLVVLLVQQEKPIAWVN